MRFQLTPTPSFFEELARRLYRRHENKLVRQERWGLPEGGLTSTLNRAEMGNAAAHPEPQPVLARDRRSPPTAREACKTIAAAVQSRRGENRLHRRWMLVRRHLYRRRFPRALGPLHPLAALARLGRRGRAPARAAVRADEGRPRPAGGAPADPRAARGDARRTDVEPTRQARRHTRTPSTTPPDGRVSTRTSRRCDYPVMRRCCAAENAAALIHPDDRKYGALARRRAGHAARPRRCCACYLNDIRDADAAPIVIDPKSELARLCLASRRPDCGKRVWFLDLGHPAFGMSPLRLPRRPPAGARGRRRSPRTSSPRCWTSTRTRSSSPRAATSTTRSSARSRSPNASSAARRFEDVYTLLLPAEGRLPRRRRGGVRRPAPTSTQTAEFFRSELPDDLRSPPAASPTRSTRRATRSAG